MRVTEVRQLDGEMWSVVYADDAHEHRFSHDALRWRAAEYGIDPEDSSALLDVVLHEPFIDTSADHPEFLYRVDQDIARSAHLRKIDQARDGTGIHDPDGLLRVVHEHHARTHTTESHEAKTAAVYAIRNPVPMTLE